MARVRGARAWRGGCGVGRGRSAERWWLARWRWQAPLKEAFGEGGIDAAMRYDNGRGIITGHEIEPLYGNTYLPKKFKIAFTVPGDNSVDLLARPC